MISDIFTLRILTRTVRETEHNFPGTFYTFMPKKLENDFCVPAAIVVLCRSAMKIGISGHTCEDSLENI